MTAAALDLTITAPGVYPDVPMDTYLQAPALSASGARKLLPPYAPAIYRWEQDHRTDSADFDLGKAVHKVVLGDANAEIVIIDADDWRTTAARKQRDQARQAGKIPILVEAYLQVEAMATAVCEHPVAGQLFQPDAGKPEQSIFWTDKETGVPCRCRLDWLPDKIDGRRIIIRDLKTARSAHPEQFAKSAIDFGYAIQDFWYRDAVRAVGLDDDPAFLFVVVEKSPPYLVSVIELDEPSVNVGRNLARNARLIYRDCVEAGRWGGYSDGIELVGLPAWYLRRFDEEPST